MALSAISQSTQLSSLQANFQQIRKEFTQLGQDLSAGNLTQAQTDFVTLSQSALSQFGSNSPITQALSSVGQALQSGNLSAAQQAFKSLPTGSTPPNAISSHAHHHHAHTQLDQSFDQLGQALQSGNLTAAQQAFTALQQNWPTVASTTAFNQPAATAGTTVNSVDLSA
jgi:soluble cytochrome b562